MFLFIFYILIIHCVTVNGESLILEPIGDQILLKYVSKNQFHVRKHFLKESAKIPYFIEYNDIPTTLYEIVSKVI
jgi:hypothetical protein